MTNLVISEKVAEGITHVILNRPDKRNALSVDLLSELFEALQKCDEDPECRVIIISGNGPVFCAGLDLSEVSDPEKIDRSMNLLARAFTFMVNTSKITIAAVHGSAVAGGAGLMSSCDLVIGAEGTEFGYPETRIGLVAALVMPLLQRRIRYGDLAEILLVGDKINAKTAKEIGLINHVVPLNELKQTAMEWAKKVCLGAPNATLLTKHIMKEIHPVDFEKMMEKMMQYHHQMRHTKEALVGARAFKERKNPNWNDAT